MPKKQRDDNEKSVEKLDSEVLAKKSKDGKKNTSLRLDKQTLKALKLHAIEHDTSVQKLIESLIYDFLQKEANKK